MKVVIHPKYQEQKKEICAIIKRFDHHGALLYRQRNIIKTFPLEDKTINIKSFKKPNWINRFAYQWIIPGKAKRSFNYAQILLEKGLNTPFPIGYATEAKIGLRKSFYISEHLDYDLTFRELIYMLNYPSREKILRQFTRFTFQLHEQGVWFFDHSPGNTLIKSTSDGNYLFSLVDINRMIFKPMNFASRIGNFANLSPSKAMINIIAEEYATLMSKPHMEVHNLLLSKCRKNKIFRYRKKKLKKWLGY